MEMEISFFQQDLALPHSARTATKSFADHVITFTITVLDWGSPLA